MKRFFRPTFLILTLFFIMLGVGPTLWSVDEAYRPLTPDDELQLPTSTVVVRLHVQDRNHLNVVAGKLDIWETHSDEGYVVAAVTPEQYAWLTGLGYRLEIDDAKTRALGITAVLDSRFYFFDSYNPNPNNRYAVDFLQSTTFVYPTLTQLYDIGDAWMAGQEGEYDRDIWVLRITNEDPAYGPIEDKPVFFLFGGIHAREVAIPELAIRYIQYLTSGYDGAGGYDIDPDVTWLVDHHVIYVLVMQNPDGHYFNELDTNNYRRKNYDWDDGCGDSSSWGVDLNRNHSFLWSCCGGSSGYACDETYRGPSAASEPETQAFQNYFATVMPDQNGPNDDTTIPPAAPITTTGVFISLHSYSDLVLWPWGFSGYGDAPNLDGLRTIGRKFAYYNGYDPAATIWYDVDGATDDWTYGKFGIPSYTFEVGPSSGSCGGFFPLYDCIDGYSGRSFWDENRPAFLYAHKIARAPYIAAYGPDTDDVAVSSSEVPQGTPVTLTATLADHRYPGDPLVNVYAAEYFVDAPGADGSGTPMSPTDGAWGGVSEDAEVLVDTAGWDVGRHYILVHGRNADGEWGPLSAVFVTVTSAPDSAITGVVRDQATGSPLDLADVTLRGGAYDQVATTSPDGLFTFSVFSGTFDLEAVAYGYYSTTVPNVTAVAGLTTTQDISLTAIPQGVVAGQVRQAGTGLPLAATLTAVSDYATLNTTSDPATGLYSLPAFSGTYTVTASALGHVPASANVTVNPGLTATQDFTLESQACLILVDDDGGQSHETYYHAALADAGYYYQTWDTATQGAPPLTALEAYQAVLWFTADRHDPGFSFYILDGSAVADLTTYLDGGGNLLMTGHNVNAGNYYTSLFGDRLATTYNGSLPDTVDYPVSGGGLLAGIDGQVTGGVYTSTDGFTPDAVAPAVGAMGVFTYTTDDPQGAGVAHDAGTFRTLNLGFGLESLSDSARQTEVLARGLDWLGCPASPVELQLAKQAQDSVPAGAPLTYTLTLTNNSLVAATGVVVSDTLPDGLGFLDASHGGVWDGDDTVTWDLSQLAPFDYLSLTLTARVGDLADGAPIVNADFGARAAQATSLWTGGPITTTVSGVAAPLASFAHDAPRPTGQTVVFTNTTTGIRLLTTTWNYGDGSPLLTTGEGQLTTTHTYTQSGWHTVALTATNTAGSSVYRETIEITQPGAVTDWFIYLPVVR